MVEVDCNPLALETSLKNLKLNFPEKSFPAENFVQREGDAFQMLERLKSEKCFFDLVILDPPAFARKKKQKTQALEAYARLAQAGAQLTSGVLFAASCSAHVPGFEFMMRFILEFVLQEKNLKKLPGRGMPKTIRQHFRKLFI